MASCTTSESFSPSSVLGPLSISTSETKFTPLPGSTSDTSTDTLIFSKPKASVTEGFFTRHWNGLRASWRAPVTSVDAGLSLNSVAHKKPLCENSVAKGGVLNLNSVAQKKPMCENSEDLVAYKEAHQNPLDNRGTLSEKSVAHKKPLSENSVAQRGALSKNSVAHKKPMCGKSESSVAHKATLDQNSVEHKKQIYENTVSKKKPLCGKSVVNRGALSQNSVVNRGKLVKSSLFKEPLSYWEQARMSPDIRVRLDDLREWLILQDYIDEKIEGKINWNDKYR